MARGGPEKTTGGTGAEGEVSEAGDVLLAGGVGDWNSGRHAAVALCGEVGGCVMCEGYLLDWGGIDLGLRHEPSINAMLEPTPSAIIWDLLTVGEAKPILQDQGMACPYVFLGTRTFANMVASL